jgi:hypothetical protein
VVEGFDDTDGIEEGTEETVGVDDGIGDGADEGDE